MFKDYKITFPEDAPIVGGSSISIDAFKLPVGIDVTGNKVRVSFGFDIFETNFVDETTWCDLKKDFKTASEQIEKSEDEFATYNKYMETIKSKYPGIIKPPMKDFKENFKVTFLGYAEFSIGNGQLVLTDSAFLSIGAEFKYTYTMQGAIWVIPESG